MAKTKNAVTNLDNNAPTRSMAYYLILAIKGFCMGSADVVPGVSGGTMAFILGIYEELVGSIRMIGQPKFIQAVLHLRIKEAIQIINLPFLLSIFAGIVSAIIILAPGIEWLLQNQPVLLWSFFFGLVLASVIAVSARVPVWNISLWLVMLAGAGLAWVLVGLTPTQTPNDWWFLILSGAIAICAMILPGISGSFILVLLSKYQFFIQAVNNRDLVSLALAGLGALIGLVTFSQILTWLFKRYHDFTVALLIGLMVGSLRKVWPWKEVLETITDRHGELIPVVEKNVLPVMSVNGVFNTDILYALILAIAGFILVIVVERLGRLVR